MKYYYGAWQNFYQLGWPVRFFIEWAIFCVIVFALLKVIRAVGKKYRLDIVLAKCWSWFVREVVYYVVRNKKGAAELDEKMIEWEQKIEGRKTGKRHPALKRCFVLLAIIIYFCAILVDLPISKNLQGYYLTEFAGIRDYFQGIERFLSKGYEQYPPLFVQTQAVVPDTAEVMAEQETPVYIKLNKKGKRGAKIRSGPSLNENTLETVNQDIEIIYQNQFENDGERYWVKVYIPVYSVEGWLSGNLIQNSQLESITGQQ